MEMIYVELLNLAVVLVVACIGFLTKQAVKLLKDKGVIAQLEGSKELVNIVVNAVEQTYKNLNGSEKLNVAKLDLVKLMQEKNIKISEKEIDVMIEASVKEMNRVISEETDNN